MKDREIEFPPREFFDEDVDSDLACRISGLPRFEGFRMHRADR